MEHMLCRRRHLLGYPHLGSAFTFLCGRVGMLFSYCPEAWGAHNWGGTQVCESVLPSHYL